MSKHPTRQSPMDLRKHGKMYRCKVSNLRVLIPEFQQFVAMMQQTVQRRGCHEIYESMDKNHNSNKMWFENMNVNEWCLYSEC